MNCKRYRKWVKGGVLGSLDASQQAKLDAHLVDCAECRALLGTERRLGETINLALAASVSPQPSPDFAARVSIRLAEESERARPGLDSARSGWLPAAVAGVVALAAFLAVIWPAFHQRRQAQSLRQTARVSAPSTPALPPGLPSAVRDNAGAVVASSAAHGRARSATARPRGARSHESNRIEDDAPRFQVMLEPGQARAILAAYRAAQTAHVDADALPQTSDQDEQLEKIKPIEINPIVVAELYPEEHVKPAGTEDTE